MITGRDKLIIDLLQRQGFCFYKGITKKNSFRLKFPPVIGLKN